MQQIFTDAESETYRISSFKRRGVYLILRLLGVAFIRGNTVMDVQAQYSVLSKHALSLFIDQMHT